MPRPPSRRLRSRRRQALAAHAVCVVARIVTWGHYRVCFPRNVLIMCFLFLLQLMLETKQIANLDFPFFLRVLLHAAGVSMRGPRLNRARQHQTRSE